MTRNEKKRLRGVRLGKTAPPAPIRVWRSQEAMAAVPPSRPVAPSIRQVTR